MKTLAFKFLLLMMVVIGVCVTPTLAQKPLKGKWIFQTQQSSGVVPVPFTFKKNMKGTLATPVGALPLVYREKGNTFSISFEGANLDPQLGSVTITIRGTKVDDNTLTADSIIVTELPDPSGTNIIPLLTIFAQGSVNGKRQ